MTQQTDSAEARERGYALVGPVRHRRVLVVFVDALGPSQLEASGGLGGLTHRGHLRGILGYSCGALPTLLTGAPPERHGRMCLFSHAEREGGVLAPLKWLGLLPRLVHERGKLRRAAAKVLMKTAGLTGYVDLYRVPPELFRWLDLPEREDLFNAERIGGVETFLSVARRAGLRVFAAPWQMPEEDRWAHTCAVLRARKPDLAFAYATELDGALHRAGNGSREAWAAARRVTERIERAVEAMRSGGGEVTTVVVGDHGMADIRDVVDPRRLLEELRGTRLFVDSTMMRFWGDDRTLERARERMAAHGLWGRWLDEEALVKRQAPVRGAPYGQALFVLREGALFAPSFVGGAVRGMHGYDLDSPSAYAAIASDAPVPEDCGALADVAGWVCSMLGLDVARAGGETGQHGGPP
ncbi:alkaline phosphatase family protein [Pyxidicoccus xibeiensis]|uniref:alkaline phosphatase family protein n=1 Tax=Pyxidicoccus xibeiensis TaxID=2906759 RepID=UPI0020A80C29|nr:alkaline phosphatase family protein [Pyxidicoccus xibeiensis]MCP3137425.1 alkaline phosphatase family protein [Pyxidicoccus xibeiensis]